MRATVIILAVLIGGLLAVGCNDGKAEQLEKDKILLKSKLEELKVALDKAKQEISAIPGAKKDGAQESGPGCETDLGVCKVSLDKCEKDPFTGKKYFAGNQEGEKAPGPKGE